MNHEIVAIEISDWEIQGGLPRWAENRGDCWFPANSVANFSSIVLADQCDFRFRVTLRWLSYSRWIAKNDALLNHHYSYSDYSISRMPVKRLYESPAQVYRGSIGRGRNDANLIVDMP
jgi:hypothetical protein